MSKRPGHMQTSGCSCTGTGWRWICATDTHFLTTRPFGFGSIDWFARDPKMLNGTLSIDSGHGGSFIVELFLYTVQLCYHHFHFSLLMFLTFIFALIFPRTCRWKDNNDLIGKVLTIYTGCPCWQIKEGELSSIMWNEQTRSIPSLLQC